MRHATRPFEMELRATQFALEQLSQLYCKIEKRLHRLERIIELREEKKS